MGEGGNVFRYCNNFKARTFFNNIFQTAFECAMKAKTTFEKVTTDALDILSSNAPAIGLNKSEFQNKVIFCRFWSPRPML